MKMAKSVFIRDNCGNLLHRSTRNLFESGAGSHALNSLEILHQEVIYKGCTDALIRNNGLETLIGADITVGNSNVTDWSSGAEKDGSTGHKSCATVLKSKFRNIICSVSDELTFTIRQVFRSNPSNTVFCEIFRLCFRRCTAANYFTQIGNCAFMPVNRHLATKRLEVHKPGFENGLCHLL